MLKYLYVSNIRIPSYGMIIIVGIVICNFIAQCKMRKDVQRMKEFYMLEIVSGIGAVIGAKVLTILTSLARGEIHFLSPNFIKEASYSYYGGLAGFFIFSFVFSRLCKINGNEIAKDNIFLLSLLHAIWKIGCFMGGCCYGIPYEGVLSVCYAEGINKLAGIHVFPVQLLEAATSLLIMVVLLVIKKRNNLYEPVGAYLTLYGVLRFLIENFRYHENMSILSDGQIYSLVCGGIGAILIYRKHRRKVINE